MGENFILAKDKDGKGIWGEVEDRESHTRPRPVIMYTSVSLTIWIVLRCVERLVLRKKA